MFAQLREEKSHVSARRSCADGKIGIELELPCFVLHSIDIE